MSEHPSFLIAAAVDRDLAGHVALAIKLYRERLARSGRARPPGLVDFEQLAARVATSGQERTGEDTDRETVDSGPHEEREWLSTTEAAQVTGLSAKTIRRRIAAGVLPAGRSGRAIRINRSDLAALFDAGSTEGET